MKLFHTPTSPFARKVMVVAHELGVPLETSFVRPSPLAPEPALSRSNPLSKIPGLVLDDGTVLYDSPVICEYLEATFGPKLLPREGMPRWHVLRLQALGDGILDAGILVFYERAQRPAELHWEPWISGQTAKVTQALDALEHEAAQWEMPCVGQVAVACAIGWLEFRNVVGPLRDGRPRLFEWYERFSARPSMQATAPHA